MLKSPRRLREQLPGIRPALALTLLGAALPSLRPQPDILLPRHSTRPALHLALLSIPRCNLSSIDQVQKPRAESRSARDTFGDIREYRVACFEYCNEEQVKAAENTREIVFDLYSTILSTSSGTVPHVRP